MLRKITETFMTPKDKATVTASAHENAVTMVDAATCAIFSQDVYFPDKDDPNRPPLPAGWKVFAEHVSHPNDNGYFGRCYVTDWDAANGPYIILFAHRGSILEIFDNKIGVLQIALGRIPRPFIEGYRFVQSTIDAFLDTRGPDDIPKFEQSQILMTGHSLGAVISDLMVAEELAWFIHRMNRLPMRIRAVTFENPGTKNIIGKYLQNIKLDDGKYIPQSLIEQTTLLMPYYSTTYLADMNIVNTCNEQAARAFTVFPRTYDYLYNDAKPPARQEIFSSVYLNLYYFITYSYDQHQMIELYKKFLSGTVTLEPAKFPTKLQESYRMYLDYGTRQKYWDGYIEAYWAENFDDVESDYGGDFDAFKSYFIKLLKESHDAAFTSNNDEKLDPHDNIQLDINEVVGTSQFGLFSRMYQKKELKVDDFFIVENTKQNQLEEAKPTPTSNRTCHLM